MQDDNLEHMEYLLTNKAYENWTVNLTPYDMLDYLTESNIFGLKQFYLKKHGLPLDSEIKD